MIDHMLEKVGHTRIVDVTLTIEVQFSGTRKHVETVIRAWARMQNVRIVSAALTHRGEKVQTWAITCVSNTWDDAAGAFRNLRLIAQGKTDA